MQISKDGKLVRRNDWSNWEEVDPKTGLVKLDEGLFFHFKETSRGVNGSIRIKRWWGTQILFRTSSDDGVTDPDDLLALSCRIIHHFRGGIAHNRYKAELLRKSKKQAKFMGSYENRNVHEVDGV